MSEENVQKTKLTPKETAVQFFKFLMFSCMAGIIQIGSFTLFSELLEWRYWPAYLVSLILSVLYNFTVNRRFTFKSATNVPVAMLKVLGYYCVFTPVTTIAGNYFVETLGVNRYIVEITTMVLNFVTEYLFCRFVVYRNSMNTNDIAKKKEAKKED
ncbi:MAG: GtrA family protein [Ruminococcaceae bacterium]|nr:GtrA family protein [Oscillospiraceae bacterium]